MKPASRQCSAASNLEKVLGVDAREHRRPSTRVAKFFINVAASGGLVVAGGDTREVSPAWRYLHLSLKLCENKSYILRGDWWSLTTICNGVGRFARVKCGVWYHVVVPLVPLAGHVFEIVRSFSYTLSGLIVPDYYVRGQASLNGQVRSGVVQQQRKSIVRERDNVARADAPLM